MNNSDVHRTSEKRYTVTLPNILIREMIDITASVAIRKEGMIPGKRHWAGM